MVTLKKTKKTKKTPSEAFCLPHSVTDHTCFHLYRENTLLNGFVFGFLGVFLLAAGFRKLNLHLSRLTEEKGGLINLHDAGEHSDCL